MEMNSPKKYPQLRKSWLQFFLILSVTFIPFFLIYNFLGIFKLESIEYRNKKLLNKAKLEAGFIQSNLNQKHVISKALKEYSQKINFFLKRRNLNSNLASKIQRKFLNQFPKSSQVIWFNEKLNQIIASPDKSPPAIRAWQALLRIVLDRPEASKIDEKIANSLVKTNVSGLLSSDFMVRALAEPLEIIYEKERIYLSILEIGNNSSKSHGYAILLIPSDRAKKDWHIKRALRVAKKQGIIAGAFHVNTSLSDDQSSISENLMHGLYKHHIAGQKYIFISNALYYTTFFNEDPELFVAIKTSLKDQNSLLAPQSIENARKLLFPAFFLMAISLFFLRKKAYQFSLRAKLSIVSASVVCIPLSAIIILGIIQSAQIELENERTLLRRHEAKITQIEKFVSDEFLKLENQINKDFFEKPESFSSQTQVVDKLFSTLKNKGCIIATLFKKNGEVVCHSDFNMGMAKERTSYFLAFFEKRMKKNGFDIKKIKETTKLPVPFRLKRFKYLPTFQHDLEGKMINFEISGVKTHIFTNFIKNKSEEVIGYVCVEIDRNRLVSSFLESAIKNQSKANERFFLKSTFFKGVNFLPANNQIQQMLDLINISGNRFSQRINHKGTKYGVYGRPLRGMQTGIVSVLKETKTGFFQLFDFRNFIILLIAMAIANSFIVFNLLQNYFLKPISQLYIAVKEISLGAFEKNKPLTVNGDELGELCQDFTDMAKKLKEKQSMQSYLHTNLVTEVSTTPEASVSKKNVTILFAGIRNFSAIEKALSPERSVEIMNIFLETCETSVKNFGGEIDKYIGDTAMAVFFHEMPTESSEAAIKSAQLISIKISENKELKSLAEFSFGIGISNGEVISGHIGSLNKRLDYTIIGDPVNIAARLEKLSGKSPDNFSILVSESVYANTKKHFEFTRLPEIKLKGKNKNLNLFEVKNG